MPTQKLSQADRDEILRLSGIYTQRQIAEVFSVSQPRITQILKEARIKAASTAPFPDETEWGGVIPRVHVRRT